MATKEFAFEQCILKHYVRTKGWLPFCLERRRKINSGKKSSEARRVRYFTFCAIGAIDVLMLDVAKVIRRSKENKFDTVVFFDRDSESVVETQKRIPGAIGFPGGFTDVVLSPEAPDREGEEIDYLAAPDKSSDQLETRNLQRIQGQRSRFKKYFPFDIINLDLEEFAFKPNDPFPGRVINSLRKIFEWQRKPLTAGHSGRTSEMIDGFTLMFTSQIGPKNMSADYRDMLRTTLAKNIEEYPELSSHLGQRAGTSNLTRLEAERFESFFKLGLPKVLSQLLLEQDWYVEPEKGIKTFEFERTWAGGKYQILHLVMDVKRQAPPIDKRGPGSTAVIAKNAYKTVVRKLFLEPEVTVTNDIAAAAELKPTLDEIRARRKKYLLEKSSP